ncbi:nuclear transport factor 2 family protein [Pseudonocardia eucalypti]|uniref:Nuclear transport factor 2 family protein n=1 Tax=Pseudonocardia eucalypti TaxID=648755 RepID=A0ABP9QG69_9PSEU|nr:putative SnoaL-like aldol condensation-catalyzing enzyme [Pseudonocardia eucalypti]
MSTPEQHRKVVEELLRRLFEARDVDAALELLHDRFVSHNPLVPHDPATTSGKLAFGEYFRTPAGRRLMAAHSEVRRIVADEDHVVVHSRISRPEPPDVAVVDILRLRDGLVAEHWDVVQPIPDRPANPHGML